MSEERTKKKRTASRTSARSGKRSKKKASSSARGVAVGRLTKKQSAEKGGSKLAAASGAAKGAVANGVRALGRFLKAPVIICVAVIVVVALLYGPTRELYCAWRENSALQTQDAQALSEKEQIESDINNLTSKDGIKDQARKLGYVDEGETRIVVEGDEDAEGTDDEDATEDVPAHLQFLDFIFGYEEEQQQ